jgi:osmotically-inducible protein OsmY
MTSDSEIKRDVEEELRWEPNVDPTDIAVAVKNGVVTLTGFVRSYAEKFAAERAAKRVAGVVGVANDLEVRLPQTDERPDPEIARDVVANLKIWLPSSWEHIKAIVKNGWVTLEGEVEIRRAGGQVDQRRQGCQQPDPPAAAARTTAGGDQAED